MIRLPTEKDFPRILEMAESFHKASPYSNLPFQRTGVREVFDAYLRNPSQCIFIMFDHGMIIGITMRPSFSDSLVTTELAWWVDEDHRGTKESLMLMKAYQDWARRIGAKLCQMAMLDEVTNLDKFYRRQGFIPAERSYIKEL